VPASYADPVPCRDDSGRHLSLAADPLETREVAELQRAWLELPADQAEIVALYYQRPDITTNPARALELGVSLKTYEEKLRLARNSLRLGARLLRAMRQVAEQWERGLDTRAGKA